ncbi:SDR family oxidoreductase [Fulvivirga lutimaris]|uniref:SDR family oxidoreductase n=1 Tax=Fulvivirga lutimaris TaxID=1819566 RepID=UPI0012BBD337|nr:SDR family oxidoreductase [Fulvivirga lutimaris]MTI40715.1 SDR family oxidoreductase [Fulvivirga lutimaris]
MKIGIIGCGWLGLSLGNELAEDGHHLIGTTTQQSKFSDIEEAGIKPFLFQLGDELPAEFLEMDLVIFTIPPRIKEYIAELEKIKLQLLKSKPWLIYISSTSVYPDKNDTVVEQDAEIIKSSHSGIALLEAEQVFDVSEFETTILRFGGLYSSDRHPGRFLAGKQGLTGASNPVNLIHRDDCIGIIKTIVSQQIKEEVFNACSPYHPEREAYYSLAASKLGLEKPSFSNKKANFKKVDSSKLIEKLNYTFKYPNPLTALDLI